MLWLLGNIIGSYHSEGKRGVGLPLGNLTSQLFSNVYMNVFDQWAKHRLKARRYIRYADDFVIFGRDRQELCSLVGTIRAFLLDELGLALHSRKIVVRTLLSGMDFLGWVNFPHHRVLRRKTKERMLKKMADNPRSEAFQSYLGLLKHGNTYKIEKELRNLYWLLDG